MPEMTGLPHPASRSDPVVPVILRRMTTRTPLFLVLAVTVLLGVFHGLLALTGTRLVINTTASMPQGIYLVRALPKTALQRGDIVEFAVPDAYRSLIYGRGWLRPGTPLLKPVAGLPGDSVCIGRTEFTVNGVRIGGLLAVDRAGLPLPLSPGCQRVGAAQFLAVSTYSDRSFDGRYMGPLPQSLIRGVATALWIF